MTIRSRRDFFSKLATGAAAVIGSRFAVAAQPAAPAPAPTPAPPAAPAPPAVAEEYVCPPCGCAMDDKVFSKPGTCPACNMQLRKKVTRKISQDFGRDHDHDYACDHVHAHADHTHHV